MTGPRELVHGEREFIGGTGGSVAGRRLVAQRRVTTVVVVVVFPVADYHPGFEQVDQRLMLGTRRGCGS